MTPQEIKDTFRARGETVRSWALKHGFDPACAYRLLNGRATGWRGKTHEVAVAIGLKPDPCSENNGSILP
ncbi:MAG: DNA-binding protein [Azoarcus sp.]|jgi:gp16 family phage-associated protein|nr:DNA-binding protein [Azoarcus sp.]